VSEPLSAEECLCAVCGARTVSTVGSKIDGQPHCYNCTEAKRQNAARTSNERLMLREDGKPYSPDMELSWQTFLGNRGAMSPEFFEVARIAYIAAWHASLTYAKRRADETKSAQAPIAKLTVPADDSDNGPYLAELYAPGLPPGEHDLYCQPETIAPYLRPDPEDLPPPPDEPEGIRFPPQPVVFEDEAAICLLEEAKAVVKLLEDVGNDTNWEGGSQTDRVFAWYEFDSLCTAIAQMERVRALKASAVRDPGDGDTEESMRDSER